MRDLYIVEKEGVYLHGVFFITESIKEAIEECNRLAVCDRDDYHSWIVSIYKSGCNPEHDPDHKEVHRTDRKKQMEADGQTYFVRRPNAKG